MKILVVYFSIERIIGLITVDVLFFSMVSLHLADTSKKLVILKFWIMFCLYVDGYFVVKVL